MVLSAAAKFNLAVLVWTAVFIAAGGSVLWALDRSGHLPAPPITATFCIDEKFKFLRETSIRDPNLIAVGSSVAWRSIDLSGLGERTSGALRPLNAAPCFLKVHETAFLTDFYLDNIPSVRTVLSIFAMRDFENCRTSPDFFDPVQTRRYVFEGWPAWHLYFLNFRPHLFVRDMMKIRAMRSGVDKNSLWMDHYGSGPSLLAPPETREDVVPTPECFDHLEQFGHQLAARGVAWVVVLLPPMRAWLKAYDPEGQRDRAWRSEVAKRLAGTRAIALDGAYGPPVVDEDFTDPAHLHWKAVPRFSDWIFDAMAQRGALIPPQREARR
jgi:hypothetical protein